MAIMAAILLGVVLGLSYSRKGLFLGAVVLVSVFLSIVGALGFGAVIVHTVGVRSPYAYTITMLGIALLGFAIIRGALVFMNDDVDFHPVVEHIGGALTGIATGLIIVGFLCVCLLSMPFPEFLGGAKKNSRQATSMILVPCRAAAKLLPGERPLELESLRAAPGPRFSSYEPPPSPPPEPKASSPDAEQQSETEEPEGAASSTDQDQR